MQRFFQRKLFSPTRLLPHLQSNVQESLMQSSFLSHSRTADSSLVLLIMHSWLILFLIVLATNQTNLNYQNRSKLAKNKTEDFSVYKPSLKYLIFDCILLEFDCILTAFWLHIDCILTAFYRNLAAFWLYLTLFWLHFDLTLTVFWLYFDCSLTVFWQTFDCFSVLNSFQIHTPNFQHK